MKCYICKSKLTSQRAKCEGYKGHVCENCDKPVPFRTCRGSGTYLAVYKSMVIQIA